jgi:hypothetical protein
MWKRDAGVSTMIEYLDRGIPVRLKMSEEKWAVLPSIEKFTLIGGLPDSKKLKEAMMEQARECANDFSYAARNYFQITTKKKKEQLLSLWESQHLILDKYYELKAMGKAQKIIILKARQLGALRKGTRVLTPDRGWVKIEDLRPGDKVTSLDGQRVISAEVIRSWAVEKEAIGLTFDSGAQIGASEDHPFQSNGGWATTGRMRQGSRIDRLSGGSSGVRLIDRLGVEELIDIETTSGNFIAEGLVTHNCSTLIEAMIAWRAMFYPNTRAIVVSVDQTHSSYLFGYMLYIYDHMPWWLKPMQASRKEERGLFFENEDPNLRSRFPGMNSRVMVQWANQYSGVGQGIAIDAAHVCFNPNTIIRLESGALKSITECEPGDRVITGSGLTTVVRAVCKSTRKNELMSELRLWGNPIPLSTTRDHKILSPSGFRQAKDFRAGDFAVVPVRQITSERRVFEVCNLRTGGGKQSICYRRRFAVHQKFRLNYEWGWLFGLYLAEGTIHKSARAHECLIGDAITFGIHRKEEEEFTHKLKLAIPGDRSVGLGRHTGLTSVLRISWAGLARFIASEFGCGPERTIPAWVWQAGVPFCKGIVHGYLEGDGHFPESSRRVMATSIRAGILTQLRDLVASLGFGWSSLYFRESGVYYGRNCKDAWTWSADGETAVKVRADMGKITSRASDRVSPHWRYSPDRKTVEVAVEYVGDGFCPEVYDLEVTSPEHSFCTVQCAVANSEFCNFHDDELEQIVNADLGNSMADEPEVFGFIEGTGEGAGRASHRMWSAFENRLDSGRWPKWYPLFLPSFFETTRVLAPPNGWRIQDPERIMRERTEKEWCRCNNQNCGKYKKGIVFGESVAGSACPDCLVGTLAPMLLTDAQCYWHQDNRETAEEMGEDAKKKWTAEQAITAEEAFQVSGYVMFNDYCREWVNSTVESEPKKKGKIYRQTGEIHGASGVGGYCYVKSCSVDHRHDETPFTVWEEPQQDRMYSIGVDVSEGIGQDYSVIFVNKIGRLAGEPDEQVAVWRDNHTKPKELAFYCNVIGRWYNDALMAIEYNTYQTTGDDVLYVYQYPNIYRWKHKDSVNPLSNKWHWWTKSESKSKLHQTAVDWLLSRSWVIRSKNFAEEMTTYQKEDYESRSVGAESGFKDDELLAGMISLYTPHELDSDEGGRIRVPSLVEFHKPARYRCWCQSCRHGENKAPDGSWAWVCDNPEAEYRCPACKSIQVRSESLEIRQPNALDFDGAMAMMGKRPEGVSYEPTEADL